MSSNSFWIYQTSHETRYSLFIIRDAGLSLLSRCFHVVSEGDVSYLDLRMKTSSSPLPRQAESTSALAPLTTTIPRRFYVYWVLSLGY